MAARIDLQHRGICPQAICPDFLPSSVQLVSSRCNASAELVPSPKMLDCIFVLEHTANMLIVPSGGRLPFRHVLVKQLEETINGVLGVGAITGVEFGCTPRSRPLARMLLNTSANTPRTGVHRPAPEAWRNGVNSDQTRSHCESTLSLQLRCRDSHARVEATDQHEVCPEEVLEPFTKAGPPSLWANAAMRSPSPTRCNKCLTKPRACTTTNLRARRPLATGLL